MCYCRQASTAGSAATYLLGAVVVAFSRSNLVPSSSSLKPSKPNVPDISVGRVARVAGATRAVSTLLRAGTGYRPRWWTGHGRDQAGGRARVPEWKREA